MRKVVPNQLAMAVASTPQQRMLEFQAHSKALSRSLSFMQGDNSKYFSMWFGGAIPNFW